MTNNQLIIQLPVTESSDFDALIYVEETLLQAFMQNDLAVVDGHDFGAGKFNIFISVKESWASVIEQVQASLKLRGVLNQALIVKRLQSSAQYVVIWPEQYGGEFQL